MGLRKEYNNLLILTTMKQKLMTKQIEKLLEKHPLYSQDGKGWDAIAYVKFFLPAGKFTWYVTEAEKQDDGGWLFFGASVIHEAELGYFTLSQLQELKVKVRFAGMLIPVGVERDMCWEPTPLCECDYIKGEI